MESFSIINFKKTPLKSLNSWIKLGVSELKTTPEKLQEYWIQWKNKEAQANCAK